MEVAFLVGILLFMSFHGKDYDLGWVCLLLFELFIGQLFIPVLVVLFGVAAIGQYYSQKRRFIEPCAFFVAISVSLAARMFAAFS